MRGHRARVLVAVVAAGVVPMQTARLGAQVAGSAGAATSSAGVVGLAASAPSVYARIRAAADSGSTVETAAHELLDRIGPRLTGSPGYRRAAAWLVAWYRERGIDTGTEVFDTLSAWERGPSGLELVTPRYRRLEGMVTAWSAPSPGAVRGPVVSLPDGAATRDSTAFQRWLDGVAGAYVLVSWLEPSCRTAEAWDESAAPPEAGLWQARRDSLQAAWWARLERVGLDWEGLFSALDGTGAAGIILSQWSRGWGTWQVHRSPLAPGGRTPVYALSCEDYGLLHRLVTRGSAPEALGENRSTTAGPAPVSQVLARIPGTDLADETVMLSAHLDSWDAASGATDNGAGTLAVMEAMRILAEVLPRPRRTIVAGHWGGEELGFRGSARWATAHPEAVESIQLLLNLDRGTGRPTALDAGGFVDVPGTLARWLAEAGAPEGLLALRDSGKMDTGGSDHEPFLCRGVPAFYLEQEGWSYGPYTWHSNRDTADKLVLPEIRRAAVVLATLAWKAAQAPDRLSRETSWAADAPTERCGEPGAP